MNKKNSQNSPPEKVSNHKWKKDFKSYFRTTFGNQISWIELNSIFVPTILFSDVISKQTPFEMVDLSFPFLPDL